MKKSRFSEADGEDSAGGGSGERRGRGEEARDQRRDDLRLAEAFGQLEAVDVKRLRQLEQENLKLKKLVAERDLEIDVMREIAAKKW
jgi:hypothetical protein